jgi:inorganic pyrophosphatase
MGAQFLYDSPMRLLVVPALLAVLWQAPAAPPATLPEGAGAQLARSLTEARTHRRHLWRDVAPFNADGTINAYIEIFRGDRRKWEFNMRHNRRAIDRVMPRALGGYPVNYGFVPQTVSYDGDPFDALVLGPPARGGTVVRGMIVGVMHMEDERGLDSKVVLSPMRRGKPKYALTDAERERIGRFFNLYKRHEPERFSRVLGWGSSEDGLAFVRKTHQFFHEAASNRR